MNNDIANIDDDDFQIANVSDAQLSKLTERAFLPYVKLIGTGSAEAESGVYKPGTWIFCKGKDNITDLTNSTEILLLCSRPRACRKTQTGILSYYDMDAAEYKKVEADSQIKGNMGAWHGTEFLVWSRAMRAFCTYHASSATARGRCAELITLLMNWRDSRDARKKAKAAGNEEPQEKRPQCTFKSVLIEYKSINKKQWGPVFAPATTPFSEYPSLEEMKSQSTRFLAPPKSDVETVTAGKDSQPTAEGRG